LCPPEFGWFPEKITQDLDFIILGMHARNDNPELAKAKELGITIYSFPEYVYKHSENKKKGGYRRKPRQNHHDGHDSPCAPQMQSGL
jgi:hypothetical protein